MATADYYVYILKCADGTYYTGITTDPARRLQEHNAGTAAKYTHPPSRRPVEMIYTEEAGDRSNASKREYEIKQLTRKQKEGLMQKNRP
ncbi:MAG: GIY-YIG nuclease family protein [Clostridia bacterium]|nr:GIY-YIG nuclease family protein [Clostridia bacterium]